MRHMFHIAFNMKPYSSLLLFVSLILLLLIETSGRLHSHRNIVHDTCQKIAASSPNINYTVCVEVFDSVPKSQRSDLKGLGIIAANIARTNATGIRCVIRRMIRSESSAPPYYRSCLETCMDVYTDAMSSLKDSVKAIRGARYEDANILISSVLDTPGSCEDGFTEGGVESPLSEVDEAFFGLVAIDLGIVALLQQGAGL